MDNADEELLHNLFVPLHKKGGRIVDGAVTKLKFYLVEVEAFIGPVTVVPDIGGAPNGYFMVKNRAEWLDEFHDWLLNEEILEVTFLDDESTDDEYEDDGNDPIGDMDFDNESDVSGKNARDFDLDDDDSDLEGNQVTDSDDDESD